MPRERGTAATTERTDADRVVVRATFLRKKTPADINAFNEEFLADAPAPNSDSEARFLKLRNQLDPSRTDVVTWPGLLDLEEGRSQRPVRA